MKGEDVKVPDKIKWNTTTYF